MPKTIKINHGTLLVSDKEKAEKFYTETLGLEKYAGLEKYNMKDSLWIKIGNQFLHITANSGEPVGNTFYHFAIEVDNLQDYVEELIAKGLEIFDMDKKLNKTSINSELEKPYRQFFTKDPDGNLIELVDTNNKFFNPIE